MTAQTQTQDGVVRALEQLRDELKLKVHLGKAEARDSWRELEDKWRELQRHRHDIETAGATSAAGVKSAAQNLIHELSDGYERIRNAL
ncbi:MAG: hypothetical protein AAGC60_13110 [Acidobacteriota bacterium]